MTCDLTCFTWQGGGGDFLRQSRDDPTSLMSYEESRLVYPPVGSTFDGHASRAVVAARAAGARGAGIDSMSDLQYRRPRPLHYGDMLRGRHDRGGWKSEAGMNEWGESFRRPSRDGRYRGLRRCK